MSYSSYIRLYFVLLGFGLVLMFAGLALEVVFSVENAKAKDLCFTLGVAGMACAFLTNASCGIHHKKFRPRGSFVSSLESRGGWFWADVGLILFLGVGLLTLSVMLWSKSAL